MDHFFSLGYAEVPVDVGSGGYIKKRDKIQVVGDDPRWYPPLVALALNPSMIEFFINELSVHNARDGFTEELVKLREDMKEVLWQRFAD